MTMIILLTPKDTPILRNTERNTQKKFERKRESLKLNVKLIEK